MSFAELHGKLSGSFVSDRSEDLLTSDVFGTLHFLGPQDGVLKWLNKARRVNCLGKLLGASRVTKMQLTFWPRFNDNHEPDVAILCDDESGGRTLVVVEAKYRSGLSGDDQLRLQCRGMEAMGSGPMITKWFPGEEGTAKCVHLLVTADTTFPARHYLGTKQTAIDMYWQSWSALSSALEEDGWAETTCEGRLVGHLVRLLRRKGLAPFGGFVKLDELNLRGDGRFWKLASYFQTMVPIELAYSPWWRRAK